MLDSIFKNHFSNLIQKIENHLAVESYFYFSNSEKQILSQDKISERKMILNLAKDKLYQFTIPAILISNMYDVVWLKKSNISNLAINATRRILIMNLIYYLVFLNYSLFYRKLYKRFYVK
jgi:hypothetical protein